MNDRHNGAEFLPSKILDIGRSSAGEAAFRAVRMLRAPRSGKYPTLFAVIQ
jgi:hypothetical protein